MKKKVVIDFFFVYHKRKISTSVTEWLYILHRMDGKLFPQENTKPQIPPKINKQKNECSKNVRLASKK